MGRGHRDSQEALPPVDIKTKLLAELLEVNMVGKDFHTYYTTFNAYRQNLALPDDNYLIAAFSGGLEPHLHHAVVTFRPISLADAIRIAQEIQSHPPPDWIPYMQTLYQQVQQATHGKLEQLYQQAGQLIQQKIQTSLHLTPTTTSAYPSKKMHIDSYLLPNPAGRLHYGPLLPPTVSPAITTSAWTLPQPQPTQPSPSGRHQLRRHS